MKNHQEIRGLLSALAGGDLPPAEEATVRRHLEACPACRAELAQLEAVVQALRTTPELEPPPWLASRIMARVRETAAPRRSWYARLFQPLAVKLPLEALALVVVCVTAWYVVQDLERSRQLPSTPAPAGQPPSGAMPKEVFVPPVPESATRPSTTPPPARSGAVQPDGVSLSAPLPKTQPHQINEPPSSVTAERSERLERAKTASEMAPAAAPGREQGGALPAPFAERRPAAKRAADQAERPAPAVSSGAPLQLRLSVDDRDATPGRLHKLVLQAGGVVRDSRPGVVLVRIEASRLTELLRQVAQLGRIVERPPLPAAGAAWVEVQISW